MKTLLIALFAVSCYGVDSLTFACGTDQISPSRCTAGGGTVTVEFTQGESYIPDFGMPIVATVSGTWTRAFYGAICSVNDSPAYLISTATHLGVTSLTTTGNYNLTPWSFEGGGAQGPYSQWKCPTGDYTTSMDWTNGGNTVSIAVIIHILPRAAFPIMLNGFGTTNDALSGWSVSTNTPFTGFVTYKNSGACNPACAPYVSYTPPQNAGDTFTDEFGNTATALTPKGIARHQESGKNPLNLDNTILISYNLTGNGRAWVGPAGVPSNTPIVISPTDYGSSDQYCWSRNDAATLYVQKGTTFGDSGTLFKKLVFSAGSYVASDVYTLPAASYGRLTSVSFGHQDCTADDWLPFFSLKDYSIVGTNVAATFTRSTGTMLAADLVGQNVYKTGSDTGLTVSSVNVGAQTMVFSGSLVCVACTITFEVPFADGAIHMTEAANPGYTPVFGPLLNNTPIVYNQSQAGNGGGLTLAPGVDSTGTLYGIGGSAGGTLQNWNVSFKPGIDSALTFGDSFAITSSTINAICNTDGVLAPPFIGFPACTSNQHFGVVTLSDGSSWHVYNGPNIANGNGTAMRRFSDAGVNPKAYPNANYTGNYIAGLPSNEYGSATGTATHSAPFFVLSTVGPVGTAWHFTSCTAANPTVCTNSASNPFANGTSILINAALGCTNLNGVHTATTVSGTSVTVNVDCSGGALTGNAFLSLAAAVSFVSANTNFDLVFACRGLGSFNLCYQIGHTRSVSFSGDDNGGFFDIPRAAMSINGKYVVYASNFGTPENAQLVSVPTPFCLGLADNAFDCTGTHAVSPGVSTTGVTLTYTTPSTGNAVIEIGQTQRLTDSAQAADPSGACPTEGWNVLSLASVSTFTCLAGTWTANTPDPTYKVSYNTSGAAAKTTSFTSLTTGTKYWYRIIADNKWGATGSFTPAGVTPITSGVNTTGAVSFRGAAVAR